MLKFTLNKKVINLALIVLGILIISGIIVYNFKIAFKKSRVSYTTYDNFNDMANAENGDYFKPVRISPTGSSEKAVYHGFFFFSCSPHELFQFDPTGRYMLGMRIFIEGREVQPSDKGEIGIFDLYENKKWIKIGETTTWNYQQGCRLQWIPGSSEEIIWNDRSEDGKKAISRIYNFRTKQTRTLPFSIYTISPDGKTALSINFERIVHKGGCNYVGIEDPFKDQWATDKVGIWKMDINSGKINMILSVRDIAKKMYPDGFPSDTIGRTLYFFREGFNPSGNRFIAFVKDASEENTLTEGFTMDLEGNDIRYFYKEPSHHFWLNDEEIIADGTQFVTGYCRYMDDGTGQPKEKYFDSPNGHCSIHKNGEWMLTDTYNIDGYFYLYMYHFPTRKFVILAKLVNNTAKYGTYSTFRVDLHPRFSPDGKLVSFDSTHEGDGRQMYIIDVSQIIDNPPEKQ